MEYFTYQFSYEPRIGDSGEDEALLDIEDILDPALKKIKELKDVEVKCID